MQKNEGLIVRFWAFALGIATIITTLFVVRINSLEIGLIFLVLLAGIIAVGLTTNFWGGLATSVVGVFAVVMVNQYAGVYPRENLVFNLASELVAFLLVGPLAGGLGNAIERIQSKAGEWFENTEELTVHDRVLGTLKPDWSKIRLEEEIIRATNYNRPLALVILKAEPNQDTSAGLLPERIAVLQALVRIACSSTQVPSIVSHLGDNHVCIILPENTASQVQDFVSTLQMRFESEKYFPQEPCSKTNQSGSIGKNLSQWGRLVSGVAALDAETTTAEALIAKAKEGLAK